MKTLFVLILLFCSGCSMVSQDVNLKQSSTFDRENFGHGEKVYLLVQDKRNSNVMGKRSMMGAAISLKNPAFILSEQIRNILKSKNFEIVDDQKQATSTIAITIRNMAYRAVTELMDIKIKTYMDIEVEVVIDSKSKFFHNYHQEDQSPHLIIPTSTENETLINQSFSKLIMQIANDKNIYHSLIKQTSKQ